MEEQTKDSSLITPNDFPRELCDELTERFSYFVIPLILDDHYAGSGVLVEIDGTSGILTAEHVIYSPQKPFNNALGSPQVLGTVPALFGIDRLNDPKVRQSKTLIRVDLLEWYPAKPHWQTYKEPGSEWGPDLALIRLPDGCNFTSELRAVRNFHTVAWESEKKMQMALHEDSFVAIAGAPGCWIESGPVTQPFEKAFMIKSGVFITGEQRYGFSENGYDYIEAVGDRETGGASIPDTFGGLSGGALWRFWVNWSDTARRNLVLVDRALAGIVYREFDLQTSAPFLRAHGPRSIYEKFLPEVRAWLAG